MGLAGSPGKLFRAQVLTFKIEIVLDLPQRGLLGVQKATPRALCEREKSRQTLGVTKVSDLCTEQDGDLWK